MCSSLQKCELRYQKIVSTLMLSCRATDFFPLSEPIVLLEESLIVRHSVLPIYKADDIC